MREPSVEHAWHCLTVLGFSVEDIPVAAEEGQKRADLGAVSDDEEYIIEAKERKPHWGWKAVYEAAVANGFATTTRPAEPWDVLGNMISKAHQQLIETPCSVTAFRVLWIQAEHEDANFVVACLRKRLLGVQRLITYKGGIFVEPIAPDGLIEYPQPVVLECYYFLSNDFKRYPAVDAAVIGTHEGLMLYVNSFSPNRDRFRRGRLYKTMQPRAVEDPEEEERQGKALILGADFDAQRYEGSPLLYIKEKYGMLANATIDSHLHFVALIPMGHR